MRVESRRSDEKDLLSVDMALNSIEAANDPEWESLGDVVVGQSQSTKSALAQESLRHVPRRLRR